MLNSKIDLGGDCVLKEIFKEELMASLANSYNLTQPYNVQGKHFEFYGQFHQRSSKYFASKKMEYYAFSSYDHIFYKSYSCVNVCDLSDLLTTGKKLILDYCQMDDEHMETSITLMLHSETLPCLETIKFIKNNMNYSKSFYWGFKGWGKLKVIILVPSSKEVITNKFAKRDEKQLLQLLHNFNVM